MPSAEEIVHQWHAEQPHPLAPSIKVGEFPVAAKLAAVLKHGQGEAPHPQEIAAFWTEFQTMNQTLSAQKKMPLGPEEFTHLAKQMARSSFAYHGRPPTMYEIGKLRDAGPKDIHDYFGALPDEHYPTVPAAEMAKALHSATPWAQTILDREPNKLEAAYLYHSGQNARDYYQSVKQDGAQDPTGGQSGTAGPAPAGGQPPDQRTGNSGVAPGTAAPSG
jgi:hypothetical protein